ncbi:unnamed protein product [Larinioides sclopetarius]|uniref:15-hydroxyprostaglandin dehydrogenase [NAD(+)] n=2 Tax=Larinioides sclopetarius TaxID=280406 RepID=A0AAV2BAD2_9ARAC
MSDSPVAIVTGGAQGLGAAICIELLKTGYRVCAADIQGEKAEEFAKQQQLVYGKENIIASPCDVSKESDYIRVFEETIKTFKRVDVLINNAGILLESYPSKTINVNLMGPIYGCYTAFKYMGKSNGGNGGVVINTSSLAGFLPAAENPVYTASKHGIIGLTRSLGLPLHFDKDGIIFACVAPHMIDTDILKSVNKTLVSDYDISKVHSHILMRPEFVAKGFMKILEDKINGSVLTVIPGEYQYIGAQKEVTELLKRNSI